MKAAVYLRVSTDGQDETNQEPGCLQICEARKWEPVIFREKMGATKKRPVWEGMMERVRRGEFGAVVAWSLSRMGRHRERVAHNLTKLFSFGALVITVQESWLDLPPGPFRDLMVQIVGFFDEIDLMNIRSKTKAGLARARAQGKVLGRKCIDPVKVKAMREAWGAGQSPAAAAESLKLNKSTVRTYFGRFEGGAKKGSENTTQQTAESQGV